MRFVYYYVSYPLLLAKLVLPGVENAVREMIAISFALAPRCCVGKFFGEVLQPAFAAALIALPDGGWVMDFGMLGDELALLEHWTRVCVVCTTTVERLVIAMPPPKPKGRGGCGEKLTENCRDKYGHEGRGDRDRQQERERLGADHPQQSVT